jgi:hypothetical protein
VSVCCRWCRIAVEHACLCLLSLSNYTARFDSWACRGFLLTRPLRRNDWHEPSPAGTLVSLAKASVARRASRSNRPTLSSPQRASCRVRCCACEREPSVRHFSRTAAVNVEESRRSFYVMSFLPPHGTFLTSQSRRRRSMLRDCRRLPIFEARRWYKPFSLAKNDRVPMRAPALRHS